MPEHTHLRVLERISHFRLLHALQGHLTNAITATASLQTCHVLSNFSNSTTEELYVGSDNLNYSNPRLACLTCAFTAYLTATRFRFARKLYTTASPTTLSALATSMQGYCEAIRKRFRSEGTEFPPNTEGKCNSDYRSVTSYNTYKPNLCP